MSKVNDDCSSVTSRIRDPSPSRPKRPTPGASQSAFACRCHPVAQRGGNSRALRLSALIAEDLVAVHDRDAASTCRAQALFHAGWQGLALYRIAHRLYENGHRISPALITWVGRIVSGMEVHPGARLGRRAFIDHGFGVVIGETCVIGDDVSLYHQVTLGSRGWWQDDASVTQRHPTIGNRVKIGTGASVLGPVTIGDDLQIRAHALVVHDLPGGNQRNRALK
jgi:serine O-acetyltransferase